MKSSLVWIPVGLWFLGCVPVPGRCQKHNDTVTLLDDLFRGYNKKVRPLDDQQSPLNVSVGMGLLSIYDFDEKTGTLSTVMFFIVLWNDFQMQWRPADYNMVNYIAVASTDVWLPTLIVTNTAEGMESLQSDWQMVHYSSSGHAVWVPGSLLKTSCAVDVRKFPFDTQSCDVEMFPWGFDADQFNLSHISDRVNTDLFVENSMWSLLSTSTRYKVLEGTNEKNVVFTITLARKSGCAIMSILTPIIALSLLNLFAFLLPVESGERVSYSVTVLLAIAVFMTIVSDELPKNSEPNALLVLLLMLELCCSSLIVVAAILNMRLFFKKEEQSVPDVVAMVVATGSGGFGKSAKTSDSGSESEALSTATNVSWQEVSKIVDAVCFSLFLLLKVLAYVIYFANTL